MLVPFLQPQNLAIPVSVKARVLKMAALFDLPLTMKVIEDAIFSPLRFSLSEDWCRRVDDISTKIRQELSNNVAEDGAELGGQTPAASTPAAPPAGAQSGGGTPGGFGC